MTSLFNAQGVSKRYGRKQVLKDINLAIGPGHCLALLGHNGAGKTTLMKILLGLTDATSGQVHLLGKDPRGQSGSEARRSVGYLPENIAFDGAMTGRELLSFYAGLKRVERRECDRLLEDVGLTGAANQRLRTYSKGMRQRLGMAQALLGDPKLLLLDEPTNGLDAPLRHHFYQTISSRTAKGATAVVSSHVLSEVEARADVIAILRAGELVAFGTLDELRQASRLPIRLRLSVNRESVGAIAEAVGQTFALDRIEDEAMYFICDGADKMAVVRHLAKLNGVVRDLDIIPPRLEDLYVHFMEKGREP